MPIKGLEARARLPRLGVIRLGVKERNAAGKEYPREVPYFVLPAELKVVLGEAKPTRLSVLFPSDDIGLVLTADYIRYSGRLLSLKCDGERFVEIPKAGDEVVGMCRKEFGKPCPCGAKALGRLNVMLLDSPVGIYQILIGGEGRLADVMTELAVFRKTLGRLTNAVFEVERTPTEIQVRKEDGTRLAKTGWPVHVRCHFTAAQALRASGVDLKALPGATETTESAKVREEEESEGTTSEDVGANGVGTPAPASTLEACEVKAQQLDLTVGEYRNYLLATYKVPLTQLAPDHLAEQGLALSAGVNDPKVGAQLTAAIRAKARRGPYSVKETS